VNSFLFKFGPVGASLLFLAGLAHAATISTDDTGVRVDAGAMGAFELEYPILVTESEQEAHKIIGKEAAGKTATIRYEGGATLAVDASHDGQITYTFSNVPADVKKWNVNTLVDFSFAQGGKWKFGDGPETPFPLAKPDKPHLFQGNSTSMELRDAQGQAITFHTPEYSYLELVDNRAWNWSIFDWHMHVPYNPDTMVYTIMVDGGADASAKAVPLVDSLGQIIALDWPEKVKSVDELQADAKSEEAYFAGFAVPKGDKYGGLPGSKEKFDLKATGFFHVEKRAKWVLVDPDGNAFFHLGVCGFSPGDDYTWIEGRHGAYEWLPPIDGDFKTAYLPGQGIEGKAFSFYLANTIRKYGKPYALEEFQPRMIQRVRQFGFNSIGDFSPMTQAARVENFPYVAGLPLGEWDDHIKDLPGIGGTWDPFDDHNRQQVETNFAAKLPGMKDDPLLIGYFLTNEPLYEDIPKVVPSLKGSTYACKRVLMQMMRDKYKTIDAFNTAWGASAKSFDELTDTPLTVSTQAAFEDVHAFTGVFFKTYFKLVADTFHQYDTNHLLIGNRFQPGTINNEQLCRAAGKYLDVMSFNYYTNGLDKDFLNRIYGWTGKPMFLSEFYWSSGKESGLVGGLDVATERDRGLAYRNYVEQAASLDYVMGIEWFTLIDQASTGRWFSKYNGERGNTGLFSVADRPWKPMVEEMAKTNTSIYDVWLGGKAPYVYDNPLFSTNGANSTRTASIPHALGPIRIDGTTQNWPGIPPEVISGKRLVIGRDAGGVEGTFKLCWDDVNLYVLASVVDPTPLKNSNTGDMLWSGDGVELFLGTEKTDQPGQLLFSDRHLLIGASAAGKAPYYDGNAPQQYDCETITVPGADGKSYTLEAAIPWTALGTQPKAGQELLFDLAFNDSADGTVRKTQLMWNGTQKNSGDRSHWGRAKLLP
jgi:hypothetical protein